MNKAETRPLLVEELEYLRKVEKEAEQEVRVARQAEVTWPGLAAVEEAWRARRLKRATAELQLWLADRQWEREEKYPVAEGPQWQVPETVSPTGKTSIVPESVPTPNLTAKP